MPRCMPLPLDARPAQAKYWMLESDTAVKAPHGASQQPSCTLDEHVQVHDCRKRYTAAQPKHYGQQLKCLAVMSCHAGQKGAHAPSGQTLHDVLTHQQGSHPPSHNPRPIRCASQLSVLPQWCKLLFGGCTVCVTSTDLQPFAGYALPHRLHPRKADPNSSTQGKCRYMTHAP